MKRRGLKFLAIPFMLWELMEAGGNKPFAITEAAMRRLSECIAVPSMRIQMLQLRADDSHPALSSDKLQCQTELLLGRLDILVIQCANRPLGMLLRRRNGGGVEIGGCRLPLVGSCCWGC